MLRGHLEHVVHPRCVQDVLPTVRTSALKGRYSGPRPHYPACGHGGGPECRPLREEVYFAAQLSPPLSGPID